MLILVLALVQAVLYGWVFGTQRGHQELHEGAHMRVPWFVQIMLKWVVPLYLLAIFAGFCFMNLPSRDVLKFQLSPATSVSEQESAVPEAWQSQFASNDLQLPATATVRPAEGGGWQVYEADQALPYSIRKTQNGLAVYAHEVGYIEKIGNNPVALASLLFVVAILAFLLLMVHIAGRRWEAEGRFQHLEA